MADKPIIFSGPMVRALLDGRKTQTRRVLKPQPGPGMNLIGIYAPALTAVFADDGPDDFTAPLRFMPGDHLWVKETGWERCERTSRMMRDGADTWEPFYYDADGIASYEHEQFAKWGFKRRPSIYCPRWASRLTLVVTDVRVQRVQDISKDDAIAEGVECDPLTGAYWGVEGSGLGGATPLYRDASLAFHRLWDSINDKRGYGWATNPWVVALRFDVHQRNIDAMQEAA